MAERQRCLMIGAGGMARSWLQHFLPEFTARLEVVGLVDINATALREGAQVLGLPLGACFTDHREALAASSAELAFICIPPAYHTEVATDCLEAGLDVLCEKPVADTWERCLAMEAARRRTGRRVQIIQNYRYTERILTFKSVLTSGRLGRLQYLCGRFAADYRTRGAWGLWRHAIPHPLLIEGAVHHFDQLRNLSGADCAQLTGWDWQPAWSSFDHQSSALFVLTMTSGARASYEANCSEAGWTNPWHREYYRAECEHGTLVLDQDNVVRIMVHDSAGKDSVEVVGPVKPPFAHGHQAQIAQFLDWREGGPTPDTVLPDNLKSVAMVFAAMQASEENRVVDVTALVAQAG